MKQEYTIFDKFAAAQEQFSHLIDHRLQSEEIRHWEHGEIENLIWKEGNERLRRLLQGHLDIRFVLEKKLEAVNGADGIILSHCRKGCERKLMSLFGEVVVRRMGYGSRGGSSIFPMDAKLNLPTDKYSHGLRQQVAEEVSKNSFDEAVSTVQRRTASKVPKRQVEEISVEVSEDFEEFYNAGRSEEPGSREDLLIMSQDGKGIVMRNEDLRDATRKAANKEEGKSKSRLGQGQKRNRKRMATVASVYSIERDLRTVEEIMEPEKAVESRPRPRAQNKRVWASVQLDMRVVTDEVFQEALRRDPEKGRKWIMLVDGHKDQLSQIRSCIKRYGVKVIVILDFIHVLEYLWKAAYCFYTAGSKEAEAWGWNVQEFAGQSRVLRHFWTSAQFTSMISGMSLLNTGLKRVGKIISEQKCVDLFEWRLMHKCERSIDHAPLKYIMQPNILALQLIYIILLTFQ